VESVRDVFPIKRFLFNKTPGDTQREVSVIGDGPRRLAVRPVAEHLCNSSVLISDCGSRAEFYRATQGVAAGKA
jgi:hypothetical protein